jgi:Uma2 family endonuclease
MFAFIEVHMVESQTENLLPKLAVEVKLPEDSLKFLRQKAEYYLANGTLMVWIVMDDKKLVEVHTQEEILLLTQDDILTGGNVIPGLSIPVRNFFMNQAGIS